jgi:hypothetical protein
MAESNKLYAVYKSGELGERDIVRKTRDGWRVKYTKSDGSVGEMDLLIREDCYYTMQLARAKREQVARFTRIIEEREQELEYLRAKLEALTKDLE